MLDFSSITSWPTKTKNILLKKWRFSNIYLLTSYKPNYYSTDYISEDNQRISRKSGRRVRTIRLSENSFVHDFSDFSDPERKISYARELANSDSDEEMIDSFVLVSRHEQRYQL